MHLGRNQYLVFDFETSGLPGQNQECRRLIKKSELLLHKRFCGIGIILLLY
jgi:hypothetical protein